MPTAPRLEIALFPVAMPGIASRGALCAVILSTDNSGFFLVEETVAAGLAVGTRLIVLVTLLAATRIQRLLGNAAIGITAGSRR